MSDSEDRRGTAGSGPDADELIDPDEAELEAAIARLLQRKEAEEAAEAEEEALAGAKADEDEAPLSGELTADGEARDTAVAPPSETETTEDGGEGEAQLEVEPFAASDGVEADTIEAVVPEADPETDAAQPAAPDREIADDTRLDDAIAVLPPASVPPPAGSHSPGRIDPRIENGAAPEPAKPQPVTLAPALRGAVDPRVSRTEGAGREQRVGWLWLIPIMLFAALVGLIFLPGNREVGDSAGDLVETVRLPDAPEIMVPGTDDMAATLSGEADGEEGAQETTDRGGEPPQTDAAPSTGGGDTASAPFGSGPDTRTAETGRERSGAENVSTGRDSGERPPSIETAAPASGSQQAGNGRTADVKESGPPVLTERVRTSADRPAPVTEASEPPAPAVTRASSGTETRASAASARGPAAPPPSVKATPPAPRAAPARATVAAPATGPANARETAIESAIPTARPPARLPSELAGPGRIELPERNYRWEILPGSAADLATRVAEFDADALNAAERQGLALAIEAALDTELDGRVVGLATPDDKTMQVHFLYSEDRVEMVGLERLASVAGLPATTRVEGGWYVARQSAALRPVPDIQTRFDGADLPRGTLVERLATITGIYGDRWYLVGRNGVGFGYVSAAEVTPAGAYDGPVNSADLSRMGRVIAEQTEVRTTCRTIDIRMQGRAGETGTVCRHGDGRWLAQGPISARTAPALGLGPVSDDATLSARLVREARMTADRVPSVPAEADFIQSFNRLLADTPDGSRATAALPDGRLLDVVVLNSRVETRRVTVQRAAEVGRLPEGLRLQPGWMETRGTDTISPVPAERAGLLNGSIPSGAAIESLAAYAGAAGENWMLIGRDGVAYGYLDPRNLRMIADPSPRLRFEGWRRNHGRIVRDLVEAEVRCRDLELAASRMASRAVSVCQSPAGQWIVEDAGNALASVPGQVVFERLFR